MLCEGLILYFLLVKIFNTGWGARRRFYFTLGWGKSLMFGFNLIATKISIGIPAPIVAITAGAAYKQYGHDELQV